MCVCCVGWGSGSHSISLLDELWGQLWIFWLEGKEIAVSHLFFFFSFFVIFGQISAYKMTGPVWFSAMKSERGFEKFSAFFIFHRIPPLWICSHGTDSCRFFNTFTAPFQGLQILRSPLPATPESAVSAVQVFTIFFPLAASISVLCSEMMLIWLKAIKTDNKTGKDLALIVTMCCSWELWPLVHQQCLLMSLYSTLIFSRKQGQEMCIGLGMLEYILCTRCWANRSRNPAAGWICFGPGLTNLGPSKTQTNFLVDNKQFLSQQAAQLWEDGLWMLFKHSDGCVKDKSTHGLSQCYSCREDVRAWTATI